MYIFSTSKWARLFYSIRLISRSFKKVYIYRPNRVIGIKKKERKKRKKSERIFPRYSLRFRIDRRIRHVGSVSRSWCQRAGVTSTLVISTSVTIVGWNDPRAPGERRGERRGGKNRRRRKTRAPCVWAKFELVFRSAVKNRALPSPPCRRTTAKRCPRTFSSPLSASLSVIVER